MAHPSNTPDPNRGAGREDDDDFKLVSEKEGKNKSRPGVYPPAECVNPPIKSYQGKPR